MIGLFDDIYRGRRVLVTGNTGFKGSWLCLWLKRLGADVVGYALEPTTDPNHFSLLKLDYPTFFEDIRDLNKVSKAIRDHRPEVIFHLAAQPLVRESYLHPLETLQTNILGTANLLEASRLSDSVRAIINVTSDKCYENTETFWGYRETDPMGGYDPYSASKGCSELLTSSYRNSFFNLKEYKLSHQTLIATVRAGNVIGGGDWSKDRLIPDIIKAASKSDIVEIRNPQSTRPWQHVLEPLSGYLHLGWKLLSGEAAGASAWNFGPGDEMNLCVGEVVTHLKRYWDMISYIIKPSNNSPHEANVLKLDCTKALMKLGWRPVWSKDQTFEKTITWYKAYYDKNLINSPDNLDAYIKDAQNKLLPWSMKIL